MSLPINIEDLIHGKAIEWERLEFKRGWNPEEIVHTICAFANDLNNWGGGYVVVGIDEDNGQPVLPPYGLPQSQLDNIQGEVLGLAHQIQPNYYPITQPYLLEGKHILVIWCPAGDNRPYTAPSTQGQKSQRFPYIRFGSRSIVAKDENLRRLQELTARVPFDDRINGKAGIVDFDLSLIQAYLHEVRSDLFEESKFISMEDLCRQMYIVKGPDELLRPVNVGVLFFCREPEKFLDRCWIELVWHKDFTAQNFIEKYFKGPLHIQLRAALNFIQNNIIEQTTEKLANQAEADRYFNFPFRALEEALANAVYHKSYEIGAPIEVQVWPDKIEILSFPGPVPPVDLKLLQHQKRVVARDYRNRRIGDFLKELRLTEGRGTGFPTIYRAMKLNGSPDPSFDTDKDCTYFLTVLPAITEGVDEDQSERDNGKRGETEGERQNIEQERKDVDEGVTTGSEGVAQRSEGVNGDNKGESISTEQEREGVTTESEGVAQRSEGIEGRNKGETTDAEQEKEGISKKLVVELVDNTFPGARASVRRGIADLLTVIVNYQRRRAPEYIQMTGLAQSTMERHIRWLRAEELIDYNGGPRTGGYFITDKTKLLLGIK